MILQKYILNLSIFFIAELLFYGQANTQHSVIQSIKDSRSAGMGNCGVAVHKSSNFLNNTSHLGLIQQNGFYANFQSYFLIQGLSQINLQGLLKINSASSIGLHLSRDGSKEFNENLIGLAYSRRLASNSSIGVQLNGISRIQTESGRDFFVSPSLGAIIQIIPNLILATQINNPIPIENNSKPSGSSQFKFGLNYKINKQLNVLSELNLTSKIPTQLQFGIEYIPHEKLQLRTGYITNGVITGGLSAILKERFTTELSYSLHPVLKTSLSLGFSYFFVKK